MTRRPTLLQISAIRTLAGADFRDCGLLNENKMIVVKYKWKGLLGRPSRRWEDDIKMVIKDKECEGSCGLG
jgi:hypothetical protein